MTLASTTCLIAARLQAKADELRRQGNYDASNALESAVRQIERETPSELERACAWLDERYPNINTRFVALLYARMEEEHSRDRTADRILATARALGWLDSWGHDSGSVLGTATARAVEWRGKPNESLPWSEPDSSDVLPVPHDGDQCKNCFARCDGDSIRHGKGCYAYDDEGGGEEPCPCAAPVVRSGA